MAGTATVDALVEAAQYFRGDAVTHNDSSQSSSARNEPQQWDSTTQRYDGGNPLAANSASYSPSNAYSTDSAATYYCNDFSDSGGPNYCESKSLSNCELKQSTDNPTQGYERQENLWGSYQRCEYHPHPGLDGSSLQLADQPGLPGEYHRSDLRWRTHRDQ